MRKVAQRRRHKKQSRRIRVLLVLAVCMISCAFFLAGRLRQEINAQTPQSRLEMAAGMDRENPADNNSADFSNRDEEEWCLTLVNKWNPMKTDGGEVETVELSNGKRVDKRIYPQLQKMFDDARADGVYMIVASGYRTEEEQWELYEEKIDAYRAEGLSEAEAQEAAGQWVSIPGTSEHQLGLSVDINADGVYSAGREAYGWLAENAYKYGFINRYPADKSDITGIANEPWHYRYVGIRAAAEICSQGLCLEEYLEK